MEIIVEPKSVVVDSKSIRNAFDSKVERSNLAELEMKVDIRLNSNSSLEEHVSS